LGLCRVVGDLGRRLIELRFIDGVEKVEHVPYPTGDELWVRFNRPLDFAQLNRLVTKHRYVIVKFATLPSKLPRGLSEMLWNGVTHVIAKKISGWSKFTSTLGLEPEGIAKIARDLHGQFQIFIATAEDGIELLYEYLGLKYVPPPPPQPATVAKPTLPVSGKPASAVTKPAAPTTPAKPPQTASAPPVSSGTTKPEATTPATSKDEKQPGQA
jgi:hypothetical protein